jgi:hypothetical protein
LAGNVPACLRNKAQFCKRLAQLSCADGIRGPLEKMSVYLLREADALEKEMTVVAMTTDPKLSIDNPRPIPRSVAVR